MESKPLSADQLKKLRTPMRNIFTRSYNSVLDEFKKEQPSREEIEVGFRTLQGHHEKLMALDEQILMAIIQEDCAEEDITKEYESVERYQKEFVRIQTKVSALEKSEKEDSFSTASGNTAQPYSSYKFPKLEFKKFGGDPKDWITFWSQFSTIDADPHLPAQTKFQYLVNATIENTVARQVVDSFPLSADNYPKVIAYMKKRFGDEDTLIEIYVRDLQKTVLQRVKENGQTSIVELYDKVETQLRALESLGVTSDKYAAMLYPLVEAALPEETLREWERERSRGKRRTDKLTQLMEFMSIEVQGENRVTQAKGAFKEEDDSSKSKKKSGNQKKKGSDTPTATDLSNTTQKKKNCIFCGKGHPSHECYSGQRMSLEEKKKKVQEANACFWCLRVGHRRDKCRTRPRCPACGGKHYPIMCEDLDSQRKTSKSGGNAEQKKLKENSTPKLEVVELQNQSVDLNNAHAGGVYLQTLIADAEERFNLRIIYDSGSQKSYITKRAVKVMGCKKIRETVLTHNLFGGGELQKVKHNEYQVKLSNRDGSYSNTFTLLDQEVICGQVSQITDQALIQELQSLGIELTDVYQGRERDIHILIGADILGELLTGRIRRLRNGVVATETKLGWTVMGPARGRDNSFDNSLFVTSLHVNSFDVQDLWRLDVIGIQDAAETKSKDEVMQAANDYFVKTVKQDESGRYIVALPWIEGHPPIPANRQIAEELLRKETAKMKANGIYEKYDKIFEDWKAERIIEEVEDKFEDCSHLTHRPVLKPTSKTTPIRPVFNASLKRKGKPSVNQCLEKGQNLIELIPVLFLRFRKGKFGLSADIRRAFLQIIIRAEDRDFLRFLWWLSGGNTLRFFRHCRVVFGLTSSPYLLAAVIKHHLGKPEFDENLFAKLMERSFYVDNLMLSLPSEEKVRELIKEGTDIMLKAKFELRDWIWNEPGLPERDPVALLGLKWDLTSDTIMIDVQSLAKMDELQVISKRNVLSAVHRIFDPIGFTSPATIGIKKMVQEAWRKKKSWDEPLDEDMQGQYIKWRQQALALEQIQVSRWILPIKGKTTLHVFCDASGLAYATVIFMRTENASLTEIRFVEARNRLATIKKITIPRLELLSCLIGARLGSNVLEQMEGDVKDVVYWTDSSTALYWIQKKDNWAEFVRNRVNEITKLSKTEDWRHIGGKHNPADLPSRGCSPSKLIKSEWWEGPQWLRQKEEDWPMSPVTYDQEAIDEEKKKTVVSAFVARKPVENPWYMNLYEGKRRVTLPQMLRVFAWMLRWKNSGFAGDEIVQEELDAAEKSLVKIVQMEMISDDDPQIKKLHAYQDEDDVWRVKTKIFNRDDDEYFRLPMLLPTDHPITRMIVQSIHEKLYHCGVQALQSSIREKFWIPHARKLVRSVVHQCPRCRRFEAKRAEVPEAPLPEERVRDAVAFEVTGIDLGGPLYLKDGQKAWFVLFTCAVYRAAHLELVTSLSTKALEGALERFVARRGCPAVIFSDNGTNLVGVRNELQRVNFGIKWKLNPPAAPWWGGWFERVIGMTKKLIRRLLGKQVADFEEMTTILANCERVINARPLTYVAEDAEDLVPLTPEMFLREPRTEGEIDLTNLDCNFGDMYEERKRLLKEFKKRFRSEYLGLLVHRDNRKKQRELKVGDIVLVEMDNKKRIQWPMGVINNVLEGLDQRKRLFEVKTQGGVMKRAAQRLFPLEVPSEDVQEIEEDIAEKPEAKEKAEEVKVGKVFTRSGREIKLPLKFRV